ncbi:MAG: class A beta-lactamase-related serine hydrolase [Bacteroidia bacterium]|nr:MAG: class A beta-lactamase-related serine hydrolase [Bacteroidia bacterium]
MKNICTLLFLVSGLALYGQTTSIKNSPPLTEGNPNSVGISAERLTLIDEMLKESIDRGEIPGAVALVARHGKIVYFKAFGMADTESGRAFQRDDIFRIASQTKAITSTAVMMLWEEGKFRLDDPISKYIPEFEHAMVLDSLIEEDSSYIATPASKPITIRHLITHTSGIGYGFIDNDQFRKIYAKVGINDAWTTEPLVLEDNIRKLAKLPLHHHPGENFTYSEGIDVLGYLVEIVSGMPLDRFFQERIFTPLGMEDSYFYLPESKYHRLVPVQTYVDNSWTRFTTPYYDVDYPIKGARTYFSGGGGISSTAKDYATFLQMYLNQGELNGKRLLSRTTVQLIMANHIGDIWENSGAYHGLAFQVIDQLGQDAGGRGSAGTFQWGGYFNTQYFADPQEQVIGILMKQTQGTQNDQTAWKFGQLVGQTIDD